MPNKYDLTKPLPITVATGAVVQQAEPAEVKDGWFSIPWRLLSVSMFWVCNGWGCDLLAGFPALIFGTSRADSVVLFLIFG